MSTAARLRAHVRYSRAAWARLRLARSTLRAHLSARRGRRVAAILWLRSATKLMLPVPLLRVSVAGQHLTVRVSDESELFGAYEVFATGDYDISCGEVRRVLDLGANVGFASMLFAERYPDAEIVAVEAAPDTFARLRMNVAPLACVRVRHAAIGARGTVRIDLDLPSAERRRATAGAAVAGIGLGELLDELGWDRVDLMKIDVEGAETAVFEEAAMTRVDAIVGEFHGDQRALASVLGGFDVTAGTAPGGGAVMFKATARLQSARCSS